MHNVSLLRCGSAAELRLCVGCGFRITDRYVEGAPVKAVVSSLKPVSPCAALEACLEDKDKNFVTGLIAAGMAERDMRDVPEWESPESDRLMWEERAQSNPAGFRQDLIQAFLGEGNLHAAQQQALDLLDAGHSVFTVMGTGRGKSLIFYIHAAELALAKQKASLFVYPLRALVADQAFHLERTLGSFGLTIGTLTGATVAPERARVMQDLAAGKLDIVLTTPEYLDIHANELAQVSTIGFVVIDEAHHVGTSKAGFRPSYTRLGNAICRLGNPQVLALTATADDAIAEDIRHAFGLDDMVFDNTERSNLQVIDQRNSKKRERYLASLVAQGEKTLIYVNSRMETVALVRRLRKQEPHIASLIGFYNAGLSRAERERVETLFREGGLQVLVATSAFGEGVDIPGVRHVVLYHLPFSEVEFNQMSGRAGRDGNEAQIHLLFGKADVHLNTALLHGIAPDHDEMAQIYRGLRALQQASQQSFFELDAEDVARRATRLFGTTVTHEQVTLGVSVFEELGLVETKTEDRKQDSQDSSASSSAKRFIYVVDYKGKVELSDSVQYREGLDEFDSFMTFKDWVLGSSADQLQDRIRHPLLPFDADGEGR